MRRLFFVTGEGMRRSQSTLLTTLAVVISLLFMSQFPAISPVSNVHPDDTNQERPPTTDSDGDGTVSYTHLTLPTNREV